MNAAILIASRDLRDRGRLFLVALCMGIVPFFASLAVKENRQLAIAVVAASVGAVYACALALAMGVSIIGRDLTEKRLSFFFSRPVSAASIWVGKAAGGMATWIGAFVIVMLPTVVFAYGGWKDMLWSTGGAGTIVATLALGTALFFVSHALSTMLRSRSALVAIDFVLLAATSIGLFAMLRPILIGGGHDLVLRIVPAIGIAMLLILAIAPVWQISRGRIDPRRNHAAFSTAFWSSVAVVVLATGAYVLWVLSAPVASITEAFAVEESRDGRWTYVSGQTKNRGSYLASFLIDRETGDRERVAVSPWVSMLHAPDGRSMAWMQYDELLPGRGTFRVYTRRFEAGAKQIATMVTLPMPRIAQLSHDGSRLAVTRVNNVEVYDLASGRLLGAAPGIAGNDVVAMFFAGPDAVRVATMTRGDKPTAVVHTFDLKARKVTSSAPAAASPIRLVQFSEDGSRLFVRGSGTTIDAQSGAVIATHPVLPKHRVDGAMLRDGSTVVTRDGKLHHYDANGVERARIAVPVPRAVVVAQLGTSKIVLASGGNSAAEWTTFVVDLTSRKVERVSRGVRCAYSWWNDSLVPQYDANVTLMALDASRRIVSWDPRTGATKPLV